MFLANLSKADIEIEMTTLGAEMGTTESRIQEVDRQASFKELEIKRTEAEIKSLESQAGRQLNKLRNLSYDAVKAWEWIQAHQDDFEKPILGPPIVTCSVKDTRYVGLIENLFNDGDLMAFTAQTKNDWSKLHAQLHDTLRLARINIRTSLAKLSDYPRPISKEDQERYGFDGFALDFVDGPEGVLAMLCAEGPQLHHSAVSLADSSQRQFDMISNSAVGTWVTGKAKYKISRRREYGPEATSTSVLNLKPAKHWTNQPVDMAAKQTLQTTIRTLQQNIADGSQQRQALKKEIADCRAKQDGLQERLVRSLCMRQGLADLAF